MSAETLPVRRGLSIAFVDGIKSARIGHKDLPQPDLRCDVLPTSLSTPLPEAISCWTDQAESPLRCESYRHRGNHCALDHQTAPPQHRPAQRLKRPSRKPLARECLALFLAHCE